MQRNSESDWSTAPLDQLYTVPGLDDTPLSPIPRRTRYQLIVDGQLESIVIGDRRYVQKSAIIDFIERHAQRGAPR